jgi:hypothetical protein
MRYYARFNHGKLKRVLLDNLGHARSLWIEANRNALHGLEGIVECMKNTWKIPWNGANPVGTGFEGERESLGNPPRSGGETPNHLLVALAAGWKRVEKKKSRNEGSRPVKGFYTLGDRTYPVGHQTGFVWLGARLVQ